MVKSACTLAELADRKISPEKLSQQVMADLGPAIAMAQMQLGQFKRFD